MNTQDKPIAKLQLQIQQIDNGFLIQKPGETMIDPRTGQQLIVSQPTSFFCETCQDVCQYLNAIWPREASKLVALQK